jgi:hypothetical protein
MAQEFASLEMNVIMPLFKTVKLFQDRDWNCSVVLFEVADATGVVQDHIRVEGEKLGTVLRLAGVHRAFYYHP